MKSPKSSYAHEVPQHPVGQWKWEDTVVELKVEPKNVRRRWTLLLSAVVVVALTGCGMYPQRGSGVWPKNFWGTILHYVSDSIDFFAHLLGNSYGLAILIVTIIIRLIILPLFIKQMRYQKMMMELQPQMQKIRSQYKGDNQRIQQETMKLYQEAGTNPAAGCLPTLIQLPVLYALYGAILGNRGLSESTFLGIFHLGQRDPHFILPIVAGLTTFLSSWFTMKNQPTQQRAILFIMPLFIIFIGIRMPAGLVLYWIYTNLFTALQTYVFLARPRAQGASSGVGSAKAASTKKISSKSGTSAISSGATKPAKSAGQKSTGKSNPQAKPNRTVKSNGTSAPEGKGKSSKGQGTKAQRATNAENTQAIEPKQDPSTDQTPQKPEEPTDGRSSE
jgi:YidC/Oxa1 family membrane protein insertase